MAETEDDNLLYSRVLEAMAVALACRLGAVWEVDADGGRLSCVETWCAPGFDGEEFARVTRDAAFEPGIGLPGRVWMTGSPSWVVDLGDDPNFPRAGVATASGLASAICFPLRAPSGVLGVIELYTDEPRVPDGGLLAA